MITENLSTLKIHKLTKEQYERELANGNIDESALYLTPEDKIDFSVYATVEQMNGKADSVHVHTIDDVTDLQTTLDDIASWAVKGNMDEGYLCIDGWYSSAKDGVRLGSGDTFIDQSSTSNTMQCYDSQIKQSYDGSQTIINIDADIVRILGSHAEGDNTTASGDYSHASGYSTTALDYQFVLGKYNNADTTSIAGVAGVSSPDSQSSDETLFMVGYGTSTTNGNAFRVSANGKCRGVSTFTASGADFAELFEWVDGNPDNEDRRGLFVTLDGEKIKIANNGDDYIGVISGAEAFLGNSASEEWQGKYLTDVFGTRLVQTVEIPAKIDKITNKVITPAHTVTQYVLNPDYNPNEQYIMRENRKEWGMVGLLGQVVVIDDGTCVVGGYVKPSLNGVGTASDSGYRVMKRIDETHIKVLVK